MNNGNHHDEMQLQSQEQWLQMQDDTDCRRNSCQNVKQKQEETLFSHAITTVMIYVFECYILLPEIFVATMGAKVFSGIKDSQLPFARNRRVLRCNVPEGSKTILFSGGVVAWSSWTPGLSCRDVFVLTQNLRRRRKNWRCLRKILVM